MLIVRASYIVVYKCSDHMGNFICNTGRIYDELPFFQGSLRVSRSKDDPRTASIPQELHRRVMGWAEEVTIQATETSESETRLGQLY